MSNNKVTDIQPGLPASKQGGVPQGLDYLAEVDELIVKQEIELLEAITGFETKNKYSISNSLGQQAYFAAEDSTCLARQCCGGDRPFEMFIYDNHQEEILHLSRPFKCWGCCWGPACCFSEMTVTSPKDGRVLGTVMQERSFWKPYYSIRDSDGDQLMTISGRCCPCGCDDVPFIKRCWCQCEDGDRSECFLFGADCEGNPLIEAAISTIWTASGHEIGRITKRFRGCVAECFTTADTFNLTFPLDLDVNCKALLLGAVFLVDFMYFEASG